MGGYQLSYEALHTFIQKQAIMARVERERFAEKRDRSYLGSAEARQAVVLELANYLHAPENAVQTIWEEEA